MEEAFEKLETGIEEEIAAAGKPLSSNAADWPMIQNYGEYSADAKTVGEEFSKVNESLENLNLNSFYKITECGVLEIPDIESEGNGRINVTFEKTYENTPIVMVSVVHSPSTNVVTMCDNLSKTGVTIFVRNNYSSTFSVKVAYIVIEI